MTLEEEFLRAVKERTQACMGFFVSDNGANQFSGTFIRHAGKFFAVTASHCIDDIDDPASLCVTTYRHQKPGISIPLDRAARYLEQGSSTHHAMLDVAVLELTNEQADAIDVDWFNESNVGSAPVQPGGLLGIAGYPSKLVKLEGSGPFVVHPTPVIGFSTISTRAAPSTIRPPYDPEAEFLVDYDIASPAAAETQGVSPRGMSGCGVFAVPQLVEGEIWAPSIVLAGIQSAWLPGLDPPLLRAKRIEWVLHLLEQIDELTTN